MTRPLLLAALPVLAALTLSGCAREDEQPPAAARTPPVGGAEAPAAPVAARGEDPDVAAQRAGYVSAAQQARARYYWSEEARAAVRPADAPNGQAEGNELAGR